MTVAGHMGTEIPTEKDKKAKSAVIYLPITLSAMLLIGIGVSWLMGGFQPTSDGSGLVFEDGTHVYAEEIENRCVSLKEFGDVLYVKYEYVSPDDVALGSDKARFSICLEGGRYWKSVWYRGKEARKYEEVCADSECGLSTYKLYSPGDWGFAFEKIRDSDPRYVRWLREQEQEG